MTELEKSKIKSNLKEIQGRKKFFKEAKLSKRLRVIGRFPKQSEINLNGILTVFYQLIPPDLRPLNSIRWWSFSR